MFPLTLDGHTIRKSETRRWEVDLGEYEFQSKPGTTRRPLVVMAGDCDTEVSLGQDSTMQTSR